ncbi:MAG: amino acid adenylation domain-containing protein [Bacteroidetes bacterium]|nr:amino acid adenylation domain-containing protein [Bacteroidota bacterium]HET6244459.1 amino acid adenylation domain-containing protein [Bacteroidia bacterium]
MKDIAIIGVAGRFPEAKNIDELYHNLKAGKDSSRPLSKERLKSTTSAVNKKYKVFAWLDDVDKFDHKLFNISLAEAQNMDPHQRLMLEVAYETFESSGYSIDHFFGSNTAVYAGDVILKYWELAEKYDPTLFTGNINAATAGRIARFFNLRGSAMMIDTNCSSTLVATHLACNELAAGDAGHALVCGVRIVIKPEEEEGGADLGIMTQDGKTKSFSAAADGTSAGEAVAAVLLKPLDKALADNDIIYAVIKGSALNQDAQLSGSLTAPSSAAQAEVICKAWKKADIDPLTISYIEPHGSGTKLGDPIEIQGIDQAFKGLTDKKNFIYASALKSNIGHTDTVAGLSGLIKTVLSLKNKELFPTLHFDAPNPFIDFKNSVIAINTQLKKWDVPEGQPRRAGVSSFGLSGTNCHIILEEAPERKASATTDEKAWLINISSRNTKVFAANLQELKRFIEENPTTSIADISHTLNRGRKHYNYRFSVLCKNIESIKEAIENFLPNLSNEFKASKELKKLFFIFSDNTGTDEGLINHFISRYPSFTEDYEACLRAASGIENENIKTFAFQFAYYKLFEKCGITSPNVMGIGLGRAVIDVITGGKTLEDALKTVVDCKQTAVEELNKRLTALVEREAAKEKVAFIEIGTAGTLIGGLKNLNLENQENIFEVFDLNDNNEEVLKEFFSSLYLSGYNVNWQKAHPQNSGQKIKLPAYKFEPIRCWVKEPVDENDEELQIDINAKNQQEKAVAENSEFVSNVKIDESWTPIEQKIALLWVEVLKLEEIALDDDFFDIGGHSLIATQIISRIEKVFQVKIEFTDMFDYPTIRTLAEEVEKQSEVQLKDETEKEPTTSPTQLHYPLSAAQNRLWVLDQLEGGGTTYNLPGVMILEGKLDNPKFKKSFQKLVERHESLRTSFHTENGDLVQLVNQQVEFKITYKTAEESQLDKIVNDFVRPFDLSKAPLFRIELVEINKEKHLLLMDIHHIIADGVSLRIIFNDFVQIYAGQQLPELKIQYKDYSLWQHSFFQSEEFKKQEIYWLNKFSGELPVLNLVSNFPRPAIQNFSGEKLSFNLSKEDTANIRSLSGENGATIYMTLLAAYNVLLYKYTSQEDIVVGSVIAGRKKKEFENILGMFVNTLAMRNHPSAEKSFTAFLAEVKSTALEAYSNQDFPFEALVNNLGLQRDMSRNPLFDTLITYQNFFKDDHSKVNVNELSILPYPFENKTSKFDLTFEFFEGADALKLQIEYCTHLFNKETIERLFAHFIQIIRSVSENKNIALADINLLSTEEKEQLLVNFNPTVKTENINETVVSAFEKHLLQNPNNVAISDGNRTILYNELNEKAENIAALLLKKGLVKEGVVGVFLNASAEWLYSILGVLKAGGAYLPIDPAYPAERIDFMLKDSGAKILLTDKTLFHKSAFSGEVIDITEAANNINNGGVKSVIAPENLAYIIYTSGSTGQPKGVGVEHSALFNLCSWHNNQYNITAADKATKYAGLGFDASVWEIFPYLVSGASVTIVPEDIRMDMRKLNNFYESNGISVSFLPTQIAEQFMEQENSSLRLLLTGGDKLRSFKKQRYDVVNNYGPTENTVVSTSFKLDRFYENIPIGKPVDGTRVYILDKKGNPQPVGVPGELCVAGNNLARGYINQPELTAQKFVADPFVAGEKMYQTGDLAKWLPDGNIEFLGRIDAQVKIRGYRIELGEIENQLLSFSGIKDAVVIDVEEKDAQKFLCAYIVSETAVDTSLLKEHLAAKLPDYMVPLHFISLEKIPLNANGKVDRKALPLPDESLKTSRAYVAPITETEVKLSKLWSESLNIEKPSTEDNFFELGGHSLKATQIISRVYKVFEKEVPLREIFRNPTIKGLAAFIESAEKSAFVSISNVEKREFYPLSASQRRLYILNQFQQDNTSYNIPGALAIEGQLDTEKFEGAIKKVIQRHENLRTAFVFNNGEPVQIIKEDVAFNLSCRESSENEAKDLLKDFVKPFDLEQPPLIRAELIKIAENKHYFLFDMHHIINDEVSMNILINEFAALYEGKELEPLKFQYKDFANWQNNRIASGTSDNQKKFWLGQFKDEIPVLELPADFKRPASKSFKGNRISLNLNFETSQKLRHIALSAGATSYQLFLTAFNVLLSKYSGSEDIVVGTPIAGRNHPDLDKIIGVFINTLALRNFPKKDISFLSFLKNVKEKFIEANENSDYQFEELIGELSLKRDLSRHPLFDVLFVFQSAGESSNFASSGLNFKPLEFPSKSSKFDITFTIADSGEDFKIFIDYSTDLFKKETIEKLQCHFVQLLQSVIQKPDSKLQDLKLISKEEEQLLLNGFNNTLKNHPDSGKAIHQWFEEQVEGNTSKGIVFKNENLTFEELNIKANQLAHKLTRSGADKNQVVAIITERSLDMITGILAALKSGSAFLPIDPDYPQERIDFVLKDSNATILLTQSHLKEKADFAGKIIFIDDAAFQQEDNSNLLCNTKADDLAYIIYTSGSTGKPKGTKLTHKNLNNYVSWFIENQQVKKQDKTTLIHSFGFDGSFTNIFGALLCGHELHIIPKEFLVDPEQLLKYVQTEQISYMKFTPSLFSVFVNSEAFNQYDCSSLRMIMLGGEAISTADVEKYHLKYRNTVFVNHYGPTETTIGSIAQAIDFNCWEDYKHLPSIGYPIDNTQVYILEASLQLCPMGVVGELCISGDGVSVGYLNREDLTLEKFVVNPFDSSKKMYRTGDMAKWLPDGRVLFLGRRDEQVKIRGYRIETGEITEAVLSLKSISEAVVVDREDASGSKYLCAYFTSENEVAISEIKKELARILPEYMVPAFFVQLDKIPVTAHGKVDKRALPLPTLQRIAEKEFIAPRTITEEKLTEIWKVVLGQEKISVDDNFFEVGGHSLKAAVLAGKIFKEFQVKVSLKQIFELPTIEALAQILENKENEVFLSIEPAPVLEEYPLSSVQRRMYVLQEFDGAEITYNLPMAMKVSGKIDKKRFENAFKELINRHESLRTSFELKKNQFVQRVISNIDFKVEFIECSELQAKALADSFIKPFNLNYPPLFRVTLVSTLPSEHLLLIDMHHIISDGTSTAILIDEFLSIYEGKEIKQLALQYKDYAYWQNQSEQLLVKEEQANYWKNKLSGEIPVMNFPTDFQRPAVQDFRGGHIFKSIDKETVQQLKQLANSTGSTLYILLLTAYNVLLHKYTQQEDFIVGSPVAGRVHPDLEPVVGPFANTVVLRNHPKSEKTFSEFIAEVKDTVLNAMERQDFPFEELLGLLKVERDVSRNPLFDTLFAYQNYQRNSMEVADAGLSFSPYQFEYNISKFDISLVIQGEDELELGLEYAFSLFSEQTMETFLSSYINLLHYILKNPTAQISDIDFMSAEEKHKILVEFNNTASKWPKDKTIVQLVEEFVEREPEKIALVFGEQKMTYGELNKKANQLARKLRGLGVKPDDRVGLIIDRNFDIYISILGILKAGGAYVPIDPKNPWDRTLYMLEDSQTKIIVTQEHLLDIIDFEGTVVNVNDAAIFKAEDTNLALVNKSTDLVYMIYTSGSTGKPKGVMLEHQNVVSYAMNFKTEYSIDTDKDIMLSLTRISFDMSNTEHTASMINGITMVITTTEESNDPQQLSEIIMRTGANVMQFTPSRLTLMFSAVGDEFLNTVNILLVGAEALPVSLNKKLLQYKHLKVYNVYGPTEATTWSTGTLIEENRITIGKPHLNEHVYVLNDKLQVVPTGVSGEICVSGPGVGRGYTDQILSKVKFVENPFIQGERMYRTGDLGRWWPDGHLEFIGRSDFQVKIRGYRIELGEIENTLLEYPAITEVIVLVKEKADAKDLVAYMVCKDEVNIEELNEHLLKTLPEYMVPAHYVRLEQMPLNENGKLDRKKLPEPFGNVTSAKDFTAPVSATEIALAGIWKLILEVDKISTRDNFFTLGGNSLKAVALVSKVKEITQQEIPFTIIFNYPTIEKMAAFLEEKNQQAEQSEELTLLNEKKEKNIFAFPPAIGYSIAYSDLAGQMKEYSFYGFNFIENEDRLKIYADKIIAIQPKGDYTLFGYSAGGNLAFQVAKALSERGKKVDVVMIDSYLRQKPEPVTAAEKEEYAKLYISDDSDHISNRYLTSEAMKKAAVRKIGGYYDYLRKTPDYGKINGEILLLRSETEKAGDNGRESWKTAGTGLRVYQGVGEHAAMFNEEYFNTNFSLILKMLHKDKN